MWELGGGKRPTVLTTPHDLGGTTFAFTVLAVLPKVRKKMAITRLLAQEG